MASLRCGYGHSRLSTTLPAPLFFEAKARDYMARFAIEDVDADDDAFPVAPEEPDAGLPESGEGSGDPDDDDPGDNGLLDAAEAAEAAGKAECGELPEQAGGTGPEWPVPQDVHGSSPGTLTLARPWSRLLRNSLAVSLVETTSLTGQRVELPFEPKQLPTAEPPWSAETAAEQVGSDGTDAGGGPTDDAGTDMKDDAVTPGWVELARDKIIPVPSFATAEWLLTVTALTGNNHLIKEIHRSRDKIRDLTGFDSPAEPPLNKAVLDAMVAGMRHANFLRVLNNVAFVSVEKPKRRKFCLFAPCLTGPRGFTDGTWGGGPEDQAHHSADRSRGCPLSSGLRQARGRAVDDLCVRPDLQRRRRNHGHRPGIRLHRSMRSWLRSNGSVTISGQEKRPTTPSCIGARVVRAKRCRRPSLRVAGAGWGRLGRWPGREKLPGGAGCRCNGIQCASVWRSRDGHVRGGSGGRG